MTGGMVVVLGETGRNFGAGMSNGLAFVLDEHGAFPQRVNRELVSLERLESAEHEAALRELIERHHQATRSGRAGHILHQWSGYRSLFWVVVPHPPQVDTAAPVRPACAARQRPPEQPKGTRHPKGIFPFALLVPRVPFGGMDSTLTHLDAAGQARMVDVGAKPPTEREAVARGEVLMRPETAALIQSGGVPKGDVLATARVAGIMAAKRTADLIPLCHGLALTGAEVTFSWDEEGSRLQIQASARTVDRTGVEMEALSAVAVAALTVYDMCKAVDRGMRVDAIRLVRKTGGRQWHVQRRVTPGPGWRKSSPSSASPR